MKTCLLLTTLTLLLAAQNSFALVRLVDSCETKTGDYRVTILDNQGTGPVRTSHLSASLKDGNGNFITSFEIVSKRSGSTSFGKWHDLDMKTNGQEFDLAYPSTNDRRTLLNATLPNGQQIKDALMNCRN